MISKNKVKLQISITKELNGWIEEIIEFSKTTDKQLTKSQLIEVALRNLITSKEKEN